MKPQDILSSRLYNQQLLSTKLKSPQELVAWFGAVQSQDFPGAKWALGQRLPNSTDKTIEKAFNDGEILRTHVMRPTWHFVAPGDIRWLLQLTGPRVSQVMSTYNKILELNDEVFKKAQNLFLKLLQGGKQLTRQELKGELIRIGIKTNVQKLAHLVMQAELDGIICSGPKKGKQFTYMLLEERVPKAKKLNREEALGTLILKYFTSHGPATVKDFVWWSGLTSIDAKKGIEMNKSLKHEIIDGKEYWFVHMSSIEIPDQILLLPNYDEYTIAYKDRNAFFNPESLTYFKNQGNAAFSNAIVYKGEIIGFWKRVQGKDSVSINPQFFIKPSPTIKKRFVEAVEKFGTFFDIKAIF